MSLVSCCAKMSHVKDALLSVTEGFRNLPELWNRQRPTFSSNNCAVFTQFCAQATCTFKLSVYEPLKIGSANLESIFTVSVPDSESFPSWCPLLPSHRTFFRDLFKNSCNFFGDFSIYIRKPLFQPAKTLLSIWFSYLNSKRTVLHTT